MRDRFLYPQKKKKKKKKKIAKQIMILSNFDVNSSIEFLKL